MPRNTAAEAHRHQGQELSTGPGGLAGAAVSVGRTEEEQGRLGGLRWPPAQRHGKGKPSSPRWHTSKEASVQGR